MKVYTIAAILSLASTVMAFESTVPCLMWSPKNYIDISPQTTKQFVIAKSDASDVILSSLSSDVCSAKVIALINQPEIHSNDFLYSGYEGAFSHLEEQISEANTHSQIEYITEGVHIDQLAKSIATRCNTAVSILDPYTVSTEDFVNQIKPIVAVLPLPSADNNVNTLRTNDALLDQFINIIKLKAQDNYAVIYTSSSAKQSHEKIKLSRRDIPTTDNNLPIFEKYQLFTPGVFMVLGVVFLFLFIAGTGISWLVGIQTPVRFEGKPKKN
ncbi:vacuolar ATP synthase subunit S1-domain-containing protein [Cokeromyces recurvatus]|uniref:vacuolar ATP synthase subunit S1-domain-containing protein n=1 Tax=Cokeromyces recurvatus TaxID=90255 RepID=UPI00221F8DCD|nr:vacuolar ATP synthase subunit S1-domain-containing protein [Cokeromyces recurvatus]KAI7903943.1 vacuolar ATP synthase subunit S1-domain-containing protein [Cokeromyces recurvatus]